MALSKTAAALLAAVKPAKKKSWEDYLSTADRALLNELAEESVAGRLKVAWAALLEPFVTKTGVQVSLSAWKEALYRYRRTKDAQRKG